MAKAKTGGKVAGAPDPEPEPPDEPAEPTSNDIDARMEALLDDHIAMGARPPRDE